MELFTYLMAKNDHNTSVKKDLFSYLLGKNQSGTYTDYSGTSLSINNTKKGKMKVNLLGNTSQTGTPTPDNPIPVNVVSGDNEVVVCGKNLFDGNAVSTTTPANWGVSFENDILTIQHKTEWTTGTPTLELGKLSSGTYVLSGTLGDRITLNRNGSYSTLLSSGDTFSSNGTESISLNFGNPQATTMTYKNVMLEKSSTPSTYEPYQSSTYPIHLGTYELCKIGTYQDKFIRNSGKNLFDINAFEEQLVPGKRLNDSGEEVSDGTSTYSKYMIPVKANTTYYRKGAWERMYIYDKDKQFVSRSSAVAGFNSAYTPTEDGYIQFQIGNSYWASNKGQEMINIGSTALPYEPYGNGDWYLEKHIGKVVLDENTNIGGVGYELTNSFRFYTGVIISGQNEEAISNYFKNDTISHINTVDSPALTVINRAQIILRIDKSIATTKEELSTWLGTHNTTVYYVLLTPTYTKITGTLAEQLESVWRANSYKGQTNVSQINNDLPFELNVSVKVGS